MTEDYIDDWGEDLHDYTFHLLMCELERTGEILRMFEQGETPLTDDCGPTDDE